MSVNWLRFSSPTLIFSLYLKSNNLSATEEKIAKLPPAFIGVTNPWVAGRGGAGAARGHRPPA